MHDTQTMVNDRQTYMQLRGACDIKSIYTHHFDILMCFDIRKDKIMSHEYWSHKSSHAILVALGD